MKRILLLLALLILASPLLADEMDKKVKEIAHQLRCPTCQGLSVKESEAGLAENMKMKIRQMLEEGKSEQEVLDFFVERYGEWILRSPEMSGFNLLLWGMPGVVVLLGGLIVIYYVKNRSKRLEIHQVQPLTAEEQAQIEKDLHKLD